MKHKLFKQCDLLLITDGDKSRLYKVPKNLNNHSFELKPLNALSEPQSGLEVCPQANLVVTEYGLWTLQGELLRCLNKDKISVIKTGRQWLIIQDTLHDNNSRYCLTFWDGYSENGILHGQKLIRSKHYFALYTSSNNSWSVYSLSGVFRFSIGAENQEIVLNNHFLVSHAVGKHSLYSLHKHNGNNPEDYCIFKNQQLILCSEHEQFAICANLSGTVQAYYQRKYQDLGQAEQIMLYDQARLFSIKRNGRIFLYRFDGRPYAENICPYGADAVAYNQEDNTLLIGLNGLFRLLPVL